MGAREGRCGCMRGPIRVHESGLIWSLNHKPYPYIGPVVTNFSKTYDSGPRGRVGKVAVFQRS